MGSRSISIRCDQIKNKAIVEGEPDLAVDCCSGFALFPVDSDPQWLPNYGGWKRTTWQDNGSPTKYDSSELVIARKGIKDVDMLSAVNLFL